MSDWGLHADNFIYVAGALFILAYLIINQIVLRLILILGTFFYIAYYATAADEPLWTAMYMSSAQGTAVFIGLMLLLARNSRISLPRAYRDLYPRFEHLTPGDFRAVMRRATRYTTTEAEALGTEGAPAQRVVYIISGTARTTKRGETFPLPSGIFVGEVSYILNRGSAATTMLEPGAEILAWDRATLQAISKRNPRFKLAFEAAISRDMAAKVALAVAPGDMR